MALFASEISPSQPNHGLDLGRECDQQGKCSHPTDKKQQQFTSAINLIFIQFIDE